MASHSPLFSFRRSLLRFVLRYAPRERQRVFAVTIVVGIVCGLAAVAFHLAIQFAERNLIERALHAPGQSWIVWTILTPTLGGLISGLLLAKVVPDARGSGIPQTKVAYAIKGGRLPLRVALGKFALGVIQIGSGASLGREGPTVQICAGIASWLGRVTALPRRDLMRLLPVGAAAGVAAAFNAPIAAVTFTIEEIVGDLDQTVLSGVIVAAALAAAIERGILGQHPVFSVPPTVGTVPLTSLLFYVVLGIVAAGVSLVFTESLLRLRAMFQRLRAIPVWARPAIGSGITGVLAVVALGWFHTTGVTGGGYATLSEALLGHLGLRVLLALVALKLLATVASYSSGGAGGLFAPSLFLGGMVGGAVGVLDVAVLHHPASEVGSFALVGMGAVFAGSVRAPITSVLIIFEMTGNYGLILPLMLANMTAYILARHARPVPIYDALLQQDGIDLPHRHRPPAHVLEQLTVADAMTKNVLCLCADDDVAKGLTLVEQHDFTSYPVIESDGTFVGMLSEARLRRAQAGQETSMMLGDLVDRRPSVTLAQPLVMAILTMEQWTARQLAVVDREQCVVGMLTMSDIIRAQARAAQTTMPELTEASETLKS